MISGSPSAICAGGWLPRRLPGKRLRDLFPNNSGGKLCNKLLRSRSQFYENPEPNYYFCITVIVIISLLFLFSVLNYFKRTGTIILSHTVFKFLKGPVRLFYRIWFLNCKGIGTYLSYCAGLIFDNGVCPPFFYDRQCARSATVVNFIL